MESEGKKMTLHEFLKPLTKRSLDEYVALLLAGGKVYDGKIRDIPAFYILNPYTVKAVELNWGAQSLTVALNVPEEGET